MENITPGFHINITGRCNMKYYYCPVYGENHEKTEHVIESPLGVRRKDCTPCTITHGKDGWEVVQKCLVNPKVWS